jgi:hypothetical protein
MQDHLQSQDTAEAVHHTTIEDYCIIIARRGHMAELGCLKVLSFRSFNVR